MHGSKWPIISARIVLLPQNSIAGEDEDEDEDDASGRTATAAVASLLSQLLEDEFVVLRWWLSFFTEAEQAARERASESQNKHVMIGVVGTVVVASAALLGFRRLSQFARENLDVGARKQD